LNCSPASRSSRPADIASKPIHILLRELAERDAPKASAYVPELAGDLDWIVMKALERDPERRYGSADDLAEDISRFLTFQPISARPPSRSYSHRPLRSPSPHRRGRQCGHCHSPCWRRHHQHRALL
jgi:serine/threonine protein kinase